MGNQRPFSIREVTVVAALHFSLRCGVIPEAHDISTGFIKTASKSYRVAGGQNRGGCWSHIDHPSAPPYHAIMVTEVITDNLNRLMCIGLGPVTAFEAFVLLE
jgi:hypothetical protein